MFMLASLGRTFWLAMLGTAAAVAVGGTAYTASLTGSQASNTAAGATVIGGYQVTTVSYTLGSTPTDITEIKFKIINPGAQPTTVKARADSSGGTFYNCSTVLNGSDYDATCDSTSPQLIVQDADQLTIVVSQ